MVKMDSQYSEYVIQNLTETKDDQVSRASENTGRNLLGLLPMFVLVILVVLRISWTLYRTFGQKTRNPPPRRMYVGTHRQSLGTQEPTIYVSPSNLPPPPKYEYMAPPSYEEVVGVHYPQFAAQPITQPISSALAQANDTVTVVSEPRRVSVART